MPAAWSVVDLTAALSSQTVTWPGEAAPEFVVVDEHERDGSFSRRATLGEHVGTHFDAPVHFDPAGHDVADVPADRLVVPAVVLDLSARSATDPAARLEVADVHAHESAHGRIQSGSAVLLHTGWGTRCFEAERYGVRPDGLRFPGFGVAASRLLVEERGVVGLGIDTLGIDAGDAVDFPVHRDVTLPRGVWHLENLVGLHQLPPVGAVVVVGVPKVVGASGFPARVLALMPGGEE